jgi:NADPH:quinone reductase
MKANVITGYGDASDVFAIVEMDPPSVGPEDVLVQVHYTSLNPLDCRIRKVSTLKRSFPLVLGFDVYGEIVQVGQKVSDLSIGDRVIASPNPFRAGANADYVALKANTCLKVADLDPQQGAAIPLAGITAYEALFDRLRIKKGDTVLIHAGAGGVGHLAIQMAKNEGCRVITTASRPESVAYCKEQLQADHVINYKTESVSAYIDALTGEQGVPLILDTVGGDTFRESLGYLSPGGHICTILPVYFDAQTGNTNLLKNITISYEFMGASSVYRIAPFRQREVLRKLVDLIREKRLDPYISRIYAFEEISLAHQVMEQGHTTGKIIVAVKPQ